MVGVEIPRSPGAIKDARGVGRVGQGVSYKPLRIWNFIGIKKRI